MASVQAFQTLTSMVTRIFMFRMTLMRTITSISIRKTGPLAEIRNRFRIRVRFSMGNDIADINNDGLNDIVTLDMLPSEKK